MLQGSRHHPHRRVLRPCEDRYHQGPQGDRRDPRLIIQRVNAYAVLEPTEAINAFIDTVNQIFRKYKNLIAAKGGPTSPSKSDDKPYPTPDPAPDPENPGGDSESPDEI